MCVNGYLALLGGFSFDMVASCPGVDQNLYSERYYNRGKAPAVWASKDRKQTLARLFVAPGVLCKGISSCCFFVCLF